MIIYGISEKGLYREENQDAILMLHNEERGLFLVADGVGGRCFGAEVSHYICRAYRLWWEKELLFTQKSFEDYFSELKRVAVEINREICKKNGPGESGSTLALLFIDGERYGCISIGDSRIYMGTWRKAAALTRDDTYGNQPGNLLHAGDKEKILSAIGGFEELEYSAVTGRVGLGTIFLLCSDGVYRYLDSRYLLRMLRLYSLGAGLKQETFERTVRKIREQEPRDNYSLILVKI